MIRKIMAGRYVRAVIRMNFVLIRASKRAVSIKNNRAHICDRILLEFIMSSARSYKGMESDITGISNGCIKDLVHRSTARIGIRIRKTGWLPLKSFRIIFCQLNDVFMIIFTSDYIIAILNPSSGS